MEPITLGEIKQLLDQNHADPKSKGGKLSWFESKVFDNKEACTLFFFQRTMSQTTILYEHHSIFRKALCQELSAMLGDDDETVKYLQYTFTNRETLPQTLPLPYSSPPKTSTFNIEYIDTRGHSFGPRYITPILCMRLLPRVLSSNLLAKQLTSLSQIPYTIVEALLSTHSEAMKKFIRTELMHPSLLNDGQLFRQLENGNLICHFYAEEMLQVQMKKISPTLKLPSMQRPEDGDEREKTDKELCNTLNKHRCLIAAFEYFEYRISDLVPVDSNARNIKARFFSLFICILEGLSMVDGPLSTMGTWLTMCRANIVAFIVQHKELLERTRRAALEFARFILEAYTKAKNLPYPPENIPQGWAFGYENVGNETIARDVSPNMRASVFEASRSIVESSRPSQTVISHLYSQTISLTTKLDNYMRSYETTLDDTFYWRWTCTMIHAPETIVHSFCTSMHFMQASRLVDEAIRGELFWQKSPPVVLQFQEEVQVGSLQATMKHLAETHKDLLFISAITESQKTAAVFAGETTDESTDVVQFARQVGVLPEIEFYDIFFDEKCTYLLLSQRLLEILKKLSLLEWLLRRNGETNKATCVSLILMREYTTKPIDNEEAPQEYFSMHVFVNVLATWLRLNIIGRDNKVMTSPYILQHNHELFGCYRWLHRLIARLERGGHQLTGESKSEACEATNGAVASFIALGALHYLPYSTFSKLMDIHDNLVDGDSVLENNRDIWTLMVLLKNAHVVGCSHNSVALENSAVAFDIPWEAGGFGGIPQVIATKSVQSERLPYINALFYALVCGDWLSYDLCSEAIFSFGVTTTLSVGVVWIPKTPTVFRHPGNGRVELDGTLKMYRGLRDGNLLAQVPLLGLKVTDESIPTAGIKSHPYKPYYYKLIEDLAAFPKEEPLAPLMRYITQLEWRTYKRQQEQNVRPERRVACKWLDSFPVEEFFTNQKLLNGDIPISFEPTNFVSEEEAKNKCSRRIKTVYYDTAFLVKSLRLKTDTPHDLPSGDNNNNNNSVSDDNTSNSERPSKKARKCEVPIGQQFRGSWAKRAQYSTSVNLPHSDILDIIYRFSQDFSVERIYEVYNSPIIPNYWHSYSEICALGLDTKQTNKEEIEKKLAYFRKELAVESNIVHFMRKRNYAQHLTESPVIHGLIFDEYGGFSDMQPIGRKFTPLLI